MRNKIPIPGIFLMLTLIVQLSFSAFSQQVALIVNEYEDKPWQKEQKSLGALLGDLEVKFKVNFNYASEVVEGKFVSTKGLNKQETLEEILQHLLTPLGLKYEKLKDDLFFILEKEKVNKLRRKDITPGIKNSQSGMYRQKVQGKLRPSNIVVSANNEKTITGTVTDENDEPLPGVNILVKNTTVGTISDVDGSYRLNVPDDATTLVFSSVGYLSEEVAIEGRSEIDIQMSPDIQQLSEIVVTAFGIEREKDALGYAAQELDSKDLADTRDVNVANYLTGKVAGVQVSKLASGIGGSSSVIIRGNSSITGNNQPLYVVDGVPIVNEGMSEGGLYAEHDYGDGIGGINPQDIASISVLKGPNASALYGSRGANGVILITTKSGKGKKGLGVEINSSVGMDVINLIPTFQNKFGSGYDDTGVANYGMEEVDGEFYYS